MLSTGPRPWSRLLMRPSVRGSLCLSRAWISFSSFSSHITHSQQLPTMCLPLEGLSFMCVSPRNRRRCTPVQCYGSASSFSSFPLPYPPGPARSSFPSREGNLSPPSYTVLLGMTHKVSGAHTLPEETCTKEHSVRQMQSLCLLTIHLRLAATCSFLGGARGFGKNSQRPSGKYRPESTALFRSWLFLVLWWVMTALF